MNNRSDSIAKLAPALLKAQKEMGNAVKDSKNPFFKSKFADLNSVREAVTPALHNNGIVILQLNTSVFFGDGNLVKDVVRTTLLHESGEYIYSDTVIVSGKPNDPQAHGAALSYARRYGLSSMLSVGAEDNDAEGAMDRSSTTKNTIAKSSNKQQEDTFAQNVSHPSELPKTNNPSFGSFRKGSS